MSEPVAIAPADPAWAANFAAEADRLAAGLGTRALRIDHVGSTSVPGLDAKPVIDIQVSVADLDDAAGWAPAFERLGYQHRPSPGWEEYPFLRRPADGEPATHHVHLCRPGSYQEARHVAVRDFLRTHPHETSAYGAHKHLIAARGPSRDDYLNRKDRFVKALERRALAAAGLSAPFERLAVFCGSRTGDDPRWAEAAVGVGHVLAAHGIELVYGGGDIGLMGLVASTVLAGGGSVHGVIPGFMTSGERSEIQIGTIGRTEVVGSMHERKAVMAAAADAFVVLPGGYGTLDELFEILTWRHLRLHDKPIGLLNVAGFWDPLVRLVDHLLDTGFARRRYLEVDHRPGRLLDVLQLTRTNSTSTLNPLDGAP